MRKTIAATTFALLALGVTESALAYVGPGAGLSLLGALWGLLLAVVAALGFIVLWPLRRMLKRRRTPGTVTAGGPQASATQTAHDGAPSSRSGAS